MDPETSVTRQASGRRRYSVRSEGGRYFAAAAAALFFAALLSRFGFNRTAIGILVIGWSAILVFVLTDRIVVERGRVVRTGLTPHVASMFTGRSLRLKFANIEQVETYAVQRFKREGSVRYAYRTIVRGGGAEFIIHSRRPAYGRVIATIFAGVPDDVMDNRSLELRDYFADRRLVRSRVRASEIPGGDVLEGTWRSGWSSRAKRGENGHSAARSDHSRADDLRRLANELRIAGFLVQSLEAFRRAVLLQPRNGWLLFEFSRCILSCAASERDEAIERRGFAMNRQAEQRAGRDTELLSRLGESYLHAGNWRRASIVFRKSSEMVGATFRSVRGQAEIALREGKLAHVVHNFSVANALSQVRSLKRWTSAEVDYFSRLNGDGDYMELEISRLNLAETFHSLGNSALLVAAAGIAIILTCSIIGIGPLEDVGWTIATVAIVFLGAARAGCGILASRIPLDTIDQ